MAEPISDALATLSDRGLRRLLGARTFLRGLEYFRRRAVDDVVVEGATASGSVRGSEPVQLPCVREDRSTLQARGRRVDLDARQDTHRAGSSARLATLGPRGCAAPCVRASRSTVIGLGGGLSA